MDLSSIEPIIEQIVKQSLQDRVYLYGAYQKNLTSRVASGRLKNSIKAKETVDRDGISIIQLTAFNKPLINTYAYWLINDRKPGKWANIGDIEKWIMEKKSFKIRDFKTGQFLPKNEKNVKNVAFVISRSIGKWGFQNKPQNFIEVSIDKIIKNPQIMSLLGDQVYEDLINSIEGI